MSRLLILVSWLTFTSACADHSGREYVLVEVGDDVAQACVDALTPRTPPVCGREVVRRAARAWDAAGARLRTLEDWPAGEPVTDVLMVRGALSDLRDLGMHGYYTRLDGVRLNLAEFGNPYGVWNEQLAQSLVVHELGHAMGLQHVSQCRAIMADCGVVPSAWTPTADDL